MYQSPITELLKTLRKTDSSLEKSKEEHKSIWFNRSKPSFLKIADTLRNKGYKYYPNKNK